MSITHLARRAIIVACAVSVAEAHETWLLPDDPHPAGPGNLTWSLASGMHFGEDGTGIAPERIVVARLHGDDGAAQPLEVADTRDDVTVLQAATSAGGVHCAEIVLRPRFLTLDPASIDLYFEEIGAPAAMREAWAASESPALWRETYTKYAKGMVRVGGAGAASAAADATSGCWNAHLGHALEFVPEQDPTAVAAGGDVSFLVLSDGEPAPGQAVGLVHKHLDEHDEHGHAPLQRADANGRVRFTLDEPGRYMLYATHLVRSEREGEDWTSDFATLVFTVARE